MRKLLNNKMLTAGIILLILAAMFIFSSQTAVESAEASGRIERILRTIFKKLSESTATTLVRKGAHFMEFALLGFFTTVHTSKKNLKRLPLALVFCILAASFDELHQTFSDGRAGMITDVLLDSCGAACGTAFAAMIIRYIVRKKETHDPDGKQ